MDEGSGNRPFQVQDGENNDSRKKSYIPVSQERHRNEEKDYLANKKLECQSRLTKRKKKSIKWKVPTTEEDSDSLLTDYSSPARKKRKVKRR